MSQIAIGQSFLMDSEGATREAWRAAEAGLGRTPQAVLVFATSGYDHDTVARTLAELGPSTVIVGCSAEGVITQGRSDEIDHALGLMAFASDHLTFDGFLVEGYGAEPAQAGTELARQALAVGRAHPLALLVFPDGLSGNCTAFLDALGEGLPKGFPIVGGASADALRMDRTLQLCGTRVRSNAISALLISGPGRAAVSVGHGCRPIGRTRTVTKVTDGWVAELDGKPAWDWFRSYLEGDPQDLRADGIMHLSVGLIEEDDPDGSSVVRTPLLLRKEDGALFFPGGGIVEGSKIRLVRRDPETMRASAAHTAEELLSQGGGRRPELVLQFDCSGRGKLLFGSCAAQEIVEPVQKIVGGDVPWLGFHTYGEIAPLRGRARYHNYTVALLALYPPEA
ncbi:MAG: FIST C-terminal domain-containing protein [Sandaracinaceae bacterium]|nr:FIST C-terminal domain-containing protein [Sandaracinaceae bacterium]